MDLRLVVLLERLYNGLDNFIIHLLLAVGIIGSVGVIQVIAQIHVESHCRVKSQKKEATSNSPGRIRERADIKESKAEPSCLETAIRVKKVSLSTPAFSRTLCPYTLSSRLLPHTLSVLFPTKTSMLQPASRLHSNAPI